VHRHGYDTWRERKLFAQDVSIGAPPDAAFPGGQNWSTPPILPLESRRQGHRYLRLAYRHAMRHAGLLRIDHVMGLHRQFWIPEGADVADGVYVRYPADELYAIVSLESHRARCELVGEDLGIVPDVVRETMRRHGLRSLYVAQLTPDAPIPPDSVATLNTHDTQTFAAYSGSDERALDNALAELLASPADVVSVAIEDLWLETEPQNVPGTGDERPNWRRPMRYPLAELEARVGPRVRAFRR
jgi:4-alpha-glucanotransferase